MIAKLLYLICLDNYLIVNFGSAFSFIFYSGKPQCGYAERVWHHEFMSASLRDFRCGFIHDREHLTLFSITVSQTPGCYRKFPNSKTQ